jgi:hypothetical protein
MSNDTHPLQGARWFQTPSTELASVLTACDFNFFDPDKPAMITEVKGKLQTLWRFEETDKTGKRKARELHRAWKDPIKFCAENPKDPFTYAIAAVKNLRVFNESLKTATPMVGYQLGKYTMWMPKGHKREQEMKANPKAEKI